MRFEGQNATKAEARGPVATRRCCSAPTLFERGWMAIALVSKKTDDLRHFLETIVSAKWANELATFLPRDVIDKLIAWRVSPTPSYSTEP